MNCWEFMKCGRDEGMASENDKRSCPAYPFYGKNCASVAGTLCGGEVQGTFALKIFECAKCDFYQSKYYQHDDLKFVNACNNSICDE
jgi:hypothetical protein